MHRPDSRSHSIDSPTQPLICCTAGITSSRTYAMPSSSLLGSPRTVVDRAYMPPLLSVDGDAPAASPHDPPSSREAPLATVPGASGPWPAGGPSGRRGGRPGDLRALDEAADDGVDLRLPAGAAEDA